jgi:hypothetical protein
MDVYVIPIGRERYELYCEVADDPDAPDEPPPSGTIGKLRHRFRAMLRAAEERQHRHAESEPDTKSWPGRVQDRIMAWVAERIAEQRLLWNLRRHSSAIAVHPEDMSFEQVMTLVRRTLRRDYERHRVWLVVDTLGLVASTLLMLVPGPNLVAYYFAFRVVGHWLSMRGATQGLQRVSWGSKPCPPLSELRHAVALEPGVREQQIHAIAARLRLHHLPTFFERVAVWNA